MAAAITAPYFHEDDKAREYLESVRWPDGPVCPHCKTEGSSWTIESKPGSKNKVRPKVRCSEGLRQAILRHGRRGIIEAHETHIGRKPARRKVAAALVTRTRFSPWYSATAKCAPRSSPISPKSKERSKSRRPGART